MKYFCLEIPGCHRLIQHPIILVRSTRETQHLQLLSSSFNNSSRPMTSPSQLPIVGWHFARLFHLLYFCFSSSPYRIWAGKGDREKLKSGHITMISRRDSRQLFSARIQMQRRSAFSNGGSKSGIKKRKTPSLHFKLHLADKKDAKVWQIWKCIPSIYTISCSR